MEQYNKWLFTVEDKGAELWQRRLKRLLKYIEINIIMSTAGFGFILSKSTLVVPEHISESPVDQCVLRSNECAVNMINVISLTVYPSATSVLCVCPLLFPNSSFSVLSSTLTCPVLQVRPTQRTTVTQRSASPVLSAQAWCAWRRPAPTPTMPSASVTTTFSSARSLRSVSCAPCALWDRACIRTAPMTMTQYVRSVWTTPTLSGRAPWTPASRALSATRIQRLSWPSVRPVVTLSVTVSPTQQHAHTNKVSQSFDPTLSFHLKSLQACYVSLFIIVVLVYLFLNWPLFMEGVLTCWSKYRVKVSKVRFKPVTD